MAAEKREKIKLMIIIGLSVVFVAIAYFRFMPQKGSSAVAAPAALVADPQVAIPRVEIKNRLSALRTEASSSMRYMICPFFIFLFCPLHDSHIQKFPSIGP